MRSVTAERRFELDWIRILAILVVFLYHSTRFFNLGDWHLKNADTYVWVEIWNAFAVIWMMPLFFVISGAGLYFVLDRFQSWKAFYSNKFARLMVPVIVAAATHSIVQIYLERTSHGLFSGSFLSFLPGYFSGLYLGIGEAGNFAFHGMHLWYLLFLFLYSLLCYPLFKWLASSGRALLNRITALAAFPGMIYLLFPLPMGLMKLALPAAALGIGNGGWGFLYYLWFLIAGFILVSNDRLLNQVRNLRRPSLVFAVLFTTIYLVHHFSLSGIGLPEASAELILAGLRFAAAWCWLFAILGFGMQHLSFDHPRLKELNQGVLPFYILHQTVLLWVGSFIIPTGLWDAGKWALLSALSFILVMAAYLLLIRKSNLLRFLFGMKTTRPLLPRLWKPVTILTLHILYMALTAYSAMHPGPAAALNRAPAPMRVDKARDIMLDAGDITHKQGIRLIQDKTASFERAMAFSSGASPAILPEPQSYVEFTFTAPAGAYMVWVRGKCLTDSIQADSVWLQKDKEIGTAKGRMVGNWMDIHAPGHWAWAGNGNQPVPIMLRHGGKHRIRLQPRQTPHHMDQIWFSRSQHRIPAGSTAVGLVRIN